MSEPNRLIRRRELEGLTGLSRSAIYEKMSESSSRYDKSFPKPVRIGARAIAWRLADVHAWIAACRTVGD